MKHIFILLLLAGIFKSYSQDCNFIQDTVTFQKEHKLLNTEYLQTVLKNKSLVQLFKAENNKFYLRLIVTENLYFDKVDLLEIKSGSKSFFAKDTKHYQHGKHTGSYMIEIFKNYIGTLKDEGISSIVFGKVETDFSRQDCNQIKQISKCFYENITAKK